MKSSQIGWLAGLVGCITGALIGQSDLLGEPWKHYVTIAFVIATAISGYMLQRPGAASPVYFVQQDGMVKQVDQQGFEQHARTVAAELPQPLPVVNPHG